MSIVKTENLTFEYIGRDENGDVESINRALEDVNIDVHEGEFISVLGSNGSGKSTFAKHINAILFPTEGSVTVAGKDTRDQNALWDIRQSAGMVFQNPDNQIIGNVVEEDVGFGPENMGVPTEEIWERVNEALRTVGMEEYRKHSPNRLSGGQKQRVAIAGVVAMHPKCIIFDEPTAMLDPNGRREVIRAARALNDVEKVTVILITHYMEEVIYSDRVVIMDKGKVKMVGTPAEIFSRIDELEALRLTVPEVTKLADELRKSGLPLPEGILERKELVDHLLRIKNTGSSALSIKPDSVVRDKAEEAAGERLIIVDHLEHMYDAQTNVSVKALDDVSTVINRGDFIGLIGHTGSGKSTLVQHLNGLLKGTGGSIYFNGKDIYDKGYNMRDLRSKVGLVFQYPEHQLFEETVFKDVCFGPLNMGLSKKDAELRSFEALRKVHLPEELYYASPFELSGGQKRRVAIAGVIAMQPEVLILDEPTAGLDPAGRDEILGLVKELHDTAGITVILVSHSMDDVAQYVNRILVMNKGKLLMDGLPKDIFRRVSELEEIGLAAPEVSYIMRDLRKAGIETGDRVTTLDEAKQEILKAFC